MHVIYPILTFIPALGTIISRDSDVIIDWLSKQVTTHTPFFNLLLDQRLPNQHAFTLLRSCLIPRMNYWCRTTSPIEMVPVGVKFDKLVIDTFCQRLQLPALTDEARSQLELPVRLGGFGLVSVVLVSPAAWYSALAQSFPRISPLFDTPDDFISSDLSLVKMISTCFKWFSQFGKFPRNSPVSSTSTLVSFWADFEKKGASPGSQRAIMNVVHEKRSRSLFEKFPRNSPDRARLTSLTAPFSGSWLTTPPTDPYFTLDDTHFSLAVRLRLGIAPVDDIKRCFCGASLLEEPLHFQSCRRLGSSIARHNGLVQVISSLANHCGVNYQLEPRLDERDMSRADGHLFFHAQSVLFDVSVIFPAAASNVKSAQYRLGAATFRENSKIKHYGTRATQQGCLFFPVVLESFGGLGTKCSELISKFSDEATLNNVPLIRGIKVKTFLLRALSFALQSGNCLLDIEGSKRSRARLVSQS